MLLCQEKVNQHNLISSNVDLCYVMEGVHENDAAVSWTVYVFWILPFRYADVIRLARTCLHSTLSDVVHSSCYASRWEHNVLCNILLSRIGCSDVTARHKISTPCCSNIEVEQRLRKWKNIYAKVIRKPCFFALVM